MTKKLKLNQLKVQSFVTGLSREERAGINGGEYTIDTVCPICDSLKNYTQCGTCLTCNSYDVNCTLFNCTVCCMD